MTLSDFKIQIQNYGTKKNWMSISNVTVLTLFLYEK